jgi:hypothetical protein
MKSTDHLIPLGAGSKQDWASVTSCKFNYAERKHYESRDMMKTIQGVDVPFLGRKHFSPIYGTVAKEKLCLKVFPSIHNKQSDLTDLTSLQKLAYAPSKKKISNKYQTYTSSFFKSSKNKSLVMPSSFVSMKTLKSQSKENKESEHLISLSHKTFKPFNHNIYKPSWKDKEKIEERLEDVNGVRELSKWENINCPETTSRFKSNMEFEKNYRTQESGKYFTDRRM